MEAENEGLWGVVRERIVSKIYVEAENEGL
jgi:hypothetical protein